MRARRRMRAARLSLAVALMVLAGTGATVAALPASTPAATTGRVQILEATVTSARARRCLTRIREELTAGGFQVEVGEFGKERDDLWTADPGGSGPEGSLATITLVGNPDEGAAELWIMDGVAGGRAAIRRLPLPAGAGPHDDEVLAVRTLEFLRASALTLARPDPPRAPAPASVVAAAAAPVQREPPPGDEAPNGSAFEFGLSMLQSAPSLGPAYLPTVRVRLELPSVLEARVSVAAFGTRARLTGVQGTALVAQGVGLVELRAAFRRGHAVRPAVGAGAGAFHVSVEGAGNWPYEGLREQRWAAVFDVGAGVTIMLGRRLAIAAEGHGQLVTPHPRVLFSGAEVARLGRPALLASLTLVVPL